MTPLLLWTAEGGTRSNLRDGTRLSQPSHSETSLRPTSVDHAGGYKIKGTVQVPTVRNHGEVESRQGRQIQSNLRDLSKTYPTLWICCTHYNCMSVYDVTISNDTQRNIHLTEHHTMGVKPHHSHQALHTARQGTMVEKNTIASSRNMTTTRLDQLCPTRFFIKKIRPFPECEDESYREQAAHEWVACSRDTTRGSIGE